MAQCYQIELRWWLVIRIIIQIVTYQAQNSKSLMDLFSSFLLASWTFDGDLPKYWIFIAAFLYIFVIMGYLKVQASKKKVPAPMFAVFKGTYY